MNANRYIIITLLVIFTALVSYKLFILNYTPATILPENGYKVKIEKPMIISGESRLSYVTIMRIIENCREIHWEYDIIKNNTDKIQIDSICKNIYVDYFKPITIDTVILVTYKILNVKESSYELLFQITDENHCFCSAKMVCVLIDSINGQVISFPNSIKTILKIKGE